MRVITETRGRASLKIDMKAVGNSAVALIVLNVYGKRDYGRDHFVDTQIVDGANLEIDRSWHAVREAAIRAAFAMCMKRMGGAE